MSESQDHSPTLTTPIRSGVLGLGREGVFHLESLSLHREFEVVAAAGHESKDVDGIAGCRHVSRESLLDEILDLAVIATAVDERVSAAREFLSRGTSVLIEAGLEAGSQGELEDCLNLAREQSLFCAIWQPSLGEPDFLTAKSAVDTGNLGAVRSARFLQHCLTPDFSLSHANYPGALHEARRRLAQLLELIPSAVTAIQKTVRTEETPGELATAVTLQIEFDSGASALIDIDLAAAATLSTGWHLQTAGGGFARGEQFQWESDGEVYSVPVEATAETGAPLQYSRLAELVRSSNEKQLTFSRKSIQRESEIFDLMNRELGRAAGHRNRLHNP